MKRRKILFLIAAFLWMGMIFTMSSRNGDLSGNDSSLAGQFIGKHFVKGFEDWSQEHQQRFIEAVDHPIRKTAHASEYCVLGILFVGAYVDNKKKIKLRIIVPWVCGILYAISDECHQLFVPGRSGMITDVFIDSIGILVGVIIVNALYKFLQSS